MKKLFKKILSISAVSCLALGFAGNAVPLSASAYDSCDIDRNGAVNIMDNISMNQYLLGKQCTNNIAGLDVDGNNIVDYADSMCIMNAIVGNEYYSMIDKYSKKFKKGTKSSGITSSVMSQKYARYTYATKKSDTYTLQAGSAVSTMSADDPDLPGVIGEDTRTQDYLGGMVWLTNGGTGFIVSDHVIATSAHCVYDRGNSEKNKPPKWVDDYQIRLYNNDGTPSNKLLNPVEAHMPYNIYTNTDFSNYGIYTTGFSGNTLDKDADDKPIANSNPPKMYTGSGKIVNASNTDKNLVCYNCDVTYGNSGGPVYVKEKYITDSTVNEANVVISICSGGQNGSEPHYNCGPIMLRFYLNNEQVTQKIQSLS